MSIDLVAKEDGTDCELCGWSFDEGVIDFDEQTGKWEFRGTWGCYSGEYFEGTRDEMIEWLQGPFTQNWGFLFTHKSIKNAVEILEGA